VFIVFHTWATRFSSEYLNSVSAFEYMREHLSHPGVFAFYAVGIAAACFHFGNGLFGFAIHWGLVTGVKAQRQVARLGLVAGLVLTLVGFNALLGFLGAGVNLFQKPHAAPHEAVVVTGGNR
jgi:succinate dehydrogenase / fumarate reductase cytochrome b subunit